MIISFKLIQGIGIDRSWTKRLPAGIPGNFTFACGPFTAQYADGEDQALSGDPGNEA